MILACSYTIQYMVLNKYIAMYMATCYVQGHIRKYMHEWGYAYTDAVSNHLKAKCLKILPSIIW